MNPDDATITIVLLGDSGSGKSSLLATLVNGTFEPHPPKVVQPLLFPKEALDGDAALIVNDTDGEDPAKAVEAAKGADVVVLTYDGSEGMQEAAIKRVRDFWLPSISAAGAENVPVMVAGCKLDARSPSYDADVHKDTVYRPLMKDFPQVKLCMDCSSKERSMIGEVFHFAHRLALYPVDVLINRETGVLTDRMVTALGHVFRVFDVDGDALLNDAELTGFQMSVFKVPLSAKEIKAVKDRIVEMSPGVEGLRNGCVTERGFCTLIQFFLLKGSLEVPWSILRHFGYDDEVVFHVEQVLPSIVEPLGKDVHAELSTAAKQFLLALFDVTDADADGVLTVTEYESLLAICPEAHPWGPQTVSTCQTAFGGGVTRDGWMGLWHSLALDDRKAAAQALSFLGMDVRENAPIWNIHAPRVSVHPSERSVYRGLVFGATGSGKTAFLRGLAAKDFVEGYSADREFSVVHVFPAGDAAADRVLVLKEVSVSDTDVFVRAEDHAAHLDVAVLLYDASDKGSFAYAASLYEKLSDDVPCVFVATKSDLEEVGQDYEEEPAAFCAREGLPAPEKISVKEGASLPLYSGIWHCAHLPAAVNPKLKAELDRLLAERGFLSAFSGGITLAAVAGIAAAGAYFGFKYFSKS